MPTVMEVVMHVAHLNKLNIGEMVKVPTEDAYNTNQVRHICRSGLSLLPKQFYPLNLPIATGHSVERIECNIWNCPNCGKTYYAVEKDTVRIQ